jgi:hypothetical protein
MHFNYLSFPIYVLLDLEMLSASIEITYSVQVVLRFLLADKRNLPFSVSTAGPQKHTKNESTMYQLFKHMKQNVAEVLAGP